MNLTTIEEVVRPTALDGLAAEWREGDAWLAGGTWLFSEPQPRLRRLIDLDGLGWPSLVVGDRGLHIAATCTIADLFAFEAPPGWLAAPLIQQCCRSFLASFKIWNAATVGGNICMSLPAGPMISLATALEGVATIVEPDGGERRLPVEQFVTGNQRNVLQPGELLRAIELPASALARRTAFRRMSLTRLGRSAVLLIGTLDPSDGHFHVTVTAATVRPIRLAFTRVPNAGELKAAIERAIPDELYHDDVHGLPAYRKHLTYHFAEEIRAELAKSGSARGFA